MMNKEEFLKTLEELLSDIPEEEKHDALEYYRDFFEDATKDEKKIIDELGSPLIVAENIRKGIFEDGSNSTVKYQIEKYESQDTNEDTPRQSRKKKSNNNAVIFLAILTSPIWVSMSIALISILISLLIALAVILFSPLFIGIGACSEGIRNIVIGIGSLVTGIGAIGLTDIGVGCVFMSIGLISIVIFIKFTFRFFMWVLKGIKDFIKRIKDLIKGIFIKGEA